MEKNTVKGLIKVAWPTIAGSNLRHRGKMASAQPLTVSLDFIELGALDLWIEEQPGRKLSRPEAARRLINEGLVGK